MNTKAMAARARVLLPAVAMGLAGAVWAAPVDQSPYMGYAYPAGGRQGTVVRVKIGGQRLRNVRDVRCGQGVHAQIVEYEGAGGPLNQLQQDELRRRIQAIQAQRTGRPAAKDNSKAKPAQAAAPATPVSLPDLPELRDLEQQTPKQLRLVAARFLDRSKRPKPPIAEELTLDVTIDRNTAPGEHELRLVAPSGVSNPRIFQVGQASETLSPDPDDPDAPVPPASTPPAVLNGRIMPGAVDHFALQLKRGRPLAIVAEARCLIPYLADAVPGWFQPRLTLLDAAGKELVSADHCGFDPDPVLIYTPRHDGAYTLEIRDALYRGREDFVYRVVAADPQRAASLFPFGSRGGVALDPASAVRNPFSKPARDVLSPGKPDIPEAAEAEPNDTAKQAMHVKIPVVVKGRISRPGDTDTFKLHGKKGDRLVAEIYARRLGSPLDSLLRLIDASGRVVAINDDNQDGENGLLTHGADSRLFVNLPATGVYYVQVSDAQRHGGDSYSYLLRISAPRPDFVLRATPSGLNIPAGGVLPINVCAFRKDGFNGGIDITLKDAPTGFTLSGGRIPAGRDSVRMTIAVPRGKSDQPVVLHLEGSARIGQVTAIREVVPTDRMMQAFAYLHLVPAQEFLAAVTPGGRRVPATPKLEGDRLRIPSGGQAKVLFQTRGVVDENTQLVLSDPPQGVTLQNVSYGPDGATCTVKADAKHAGYADNLIFEMFTEAGGKPKGKAAAQGQKVSLGYLPAVPFEIVP